MTLDLSKIPKDIIDKNIVPYSYSPQPAELVKDIKTFHLTLTKLFEMFYDVYEKHPDGKPGIIFSSLLIFWYCRLELHQDSPLHRRE